MDATDKKINKLISGIAKGKRLWRRWKSLVSKKFNRWDLIRHNIINII